MTADPMQRARDRLAAECARINYLDTARAVREASDTSTIMVPADAALRALCKALETQVGSPNEHPVPASAAAAQQPVQPGMSDPAGSELLAGAERHSGPDDRARSEGARERADHQSGDRSRGPGASRDLVALTREAEVRGEERKGFAPCPTCHQYSHSISEDRITEAFNHFQSMFSHRGDGIPTQFTFDDRTRDAAQVLMAAIRDGAPGGVQS